MVVLKVLAFYVIVYVFIYAILSVARQADEYAEEHYKRDFGGNESRES